MRSVLLPFPFIHLFASFRYNVCVIYNFLVFLFISHNFCFQSSLLFDISFYNITVLFYRRPLQIFWKLLFIACWSWYNSISQLKFIHYTAHEAAGHDIFIPPWICNEPKFPSRFRLISLLLLFQESYQVAQGNPQSGR